MSGTLIWTDRLRIERAVWTFNSYLQTLPMAFPGREAPRAASQPAGGLRRRRHRGSRASVGQRPHDGRRLHHC